MSDANIAFITGMVIISPHLNSAVAWIIGGFLVLAGLWERKV